MARRQLVNKRVSNRIQATVGVIVLVGSLLLPLCLGVPVLILVTAALLALFVGIFSGLLSTGMLHQPHDWSVRR